MTNNDLEVKIATEFYESQLTEEEILQARLSSSSQEVHRSYIHCLLESYRKSLKDKCHGNLQ